MKAAAIAVIILVSSIITLSGYSFIKVAGGAGSFKQDIPEVKLKEDILITPTPSPVVTSSFTTPTLFPKSVPTPVPTVVFTPTPTSPPVFSSNQVPVTVSTPTPAFTSVPQIRKIEIDNDLDDGKEEDRDEDRDGDEDDDGEEEDD